MNRGRWALGFGAVLVAAGTCLPATAQKAPVVAAQASPPPWVEDFGDPVLADLLRRADGQSLDVRAALARVAKARAEVDIARSAGRPSLLVGLAAASGGANLHETRTAATPSLEAEYEVDLWRKFGRGREDARQELTATEYDLQAARLLVGAEIVRAYIALRLAEQNLERAAVRVRLADRRQTLVAVRAIHGAATRRDLAAETESAAQAADAVEHARAAAALRLDRLRGLLDDRELVVGPGPLGDAPASVDIGWDVDRRPDVRAALARFRAADARRAQAVAAGRPRFRLAAALGAPDAAIATLLDVRALAWAAAATLGQDLIGGSGRRAQARVAASEADLADIGYRKAVVEAWSEELAAVTAVDDARRDLRHAEAEAALARSALVRAQAGHAAGAIDGLVVAAREFDLQVSLEAADATRAEANEAHVALILARGGV